MNRYLKSFIRCWLVLLVTQPLSAGLAGGSAAYLAEVPGAKALGLGGAYTILGSDAFAAFANPACLVALEQDELALTGGVASFDRFSSAIAASFRAVTAGGHTRVFALSGAYRTLSAIDGYDAAGDPTGKFYAAALIGQASLAWSFTQNPQAGAWGFSVRVLRDGLDADNAGYGLAANLGVDLMVLPAAAGFAASLNNLGFVSHVSGMRMIDPLFSAAFKLRYPPFFGAVIALQIDKTLGVADSTVYRLSSEFTIFSHKTMPGDREAADAIRTILSQDGNSVPGATDQPLLPEAEDAEPHVVELVTRIGLAEGYLSGGFSFRYGFLEFSYGIGFDVFEEGPLHRFDLRFRL